MKHFLLHCVTFFSLLVHIGWAERLWAQYLTVAHSPATVVEGEDFSVFVECRLSSADTLNAVLVDLARGLQLVRLASVDGAVRLSFRTLPHPTKARTFAVGLSPERLPSSFALVLTLRATDALMERSEQVSLTLASIRMRELRVALLDSLDQTALLRASATFTIQPKPRHDNFAAALDSLEQASVYLPNSRASTLSLQRNFTIECWLRTTALSGVLLSTWSGVTSDAYPLEIEILSNGRLGAFFGIPFSFSRLVSRRVVADGVWHHIAVTHDSVQSSMRLFVDGVLQDSASTRLYRAAFPSVLERRVLLHIGSRAG
ncbi:MAG: LamG-like jellyroll fold domain-containing protein [Chloroherpetonaceae bacterium]|nr:LamG-like jellyroll fold domain-containing protein [Chloroherpetonaceae bacterium]